MIPIFLLTFYFFIMKYNLEIFDFEFNEIEICVFEADYFTIGKIVAAIFFLF